MNNIKRCMFLISSINIETKLKNESFKNEKIANL